MIEEAGSGAAARRNPEAGWYPDPVGRAAQRYWNGNEWTTNTRGPAPTPGMPGASPTTAHADAPATGVSSEEVASQSVSSQSVSSQSVSDESVSGEPVWDKAASDNSASDKAASDPGPNGAAVRTAGDGSSAPSKGLASWLLGGLAVALIAFVVGIAIDRTLLVSDEVDQPETATSTTTTDPLRSTTTAESSAEVEELEARLAALEEESSAALAEAQASNEALTAQVENLTTHVEAMRTWFTADVLARAQATFDAEVARACAAPEDPTLDNTRYVRGMEPAGTHVDVVNAAIDCRAGNG